MNSANPIVDPGFSFITDLARDLDNETLDLPAFPDVALSIKSALEDPNVTAEKVASLIASDPVFTAKILKLANSAMMNSTGVKIEDIKTAVTRMGFTVAYNTSIAFAVEQLRSTKAPAHIMPYLEECWHHSVQVAAFSYVLAKKLTRIRPDSALLAGLLHDLGKYYILSRAEDYPELFNTPNALDAVMAEWHTGVGRGILGAWGFSEELCSVADEHELLDRDSEKVDLTDIVLVANLFSHREDKISAPDMEWDDIPATRKLKLSQENAVDIVNESESEIFSIISALEG